MFYLKIVAVPKLLKLTLYAHIKQVKHAIPMQDKFESD